MEQSFVPRDLNDVFEVENGPVELEAEAAHSFSYHPTRWEFANCVLDRVDRVTNGRAGVFQRLFSYLFIGGSAAVVNLALFVILYQDVALPIDSKIHNIMASALSFEVSLLVNFTFNDFFTFRHLDGHRRSWFARGGRFHITALGGFVLTLFLQFCFHFFLQITAIFAQAAAILIVLFYNFTFHHLFTYRHLKMNTATCREAFSTSLAVDMEPARDDGDIVNLAATPADGSGKEAT